MKIQPSPVLWAACLVLGGFAWAGPAPAPGVPTVPGASTEDVVPLPSGWRAKASDNICGISDLQKVSNPAAVDYPTLLDATPQMKRVRKEGIDPDSTQGKLLRQQARSLITRKCQVVRGQLGHCSIWKAIRHDDGRIVPDVTGDVRSEIENEE